MPQVAYSDDRVSCFHEGQVWRSPKGTLYRVVECRRRGQAVLRQGIDGSGRVDRRPWDAVFGWVLHMEATVKTHGLTATMISPSQIELQLSVLRERGDRTLIGVAIVDLQRRGFSLAGSSDAAKASGAQIGVRPYMGPGWKAAMLNDATAALANEHRVDPAAIDSQRTLALFITGKG